MCSFPADPHKYIYLVVLLFFSCWADPTNNQCSPSCYDSQHNYSVCWKCDQQTSKKIIYWKHPIWCYRGELNKFIYVQLLESLAIIPFINYRKGADLTEWYLFHMFPDKLKISRQIKFWWRDYELAFYVNIFVVVSNIINQVYFITMF